MRAQSNSSIKSLFIILVILLICLLNPPVAWSAEVSKVKGLQVLIVDFDGAVGDQYFAIDGNGKRKAIIEIKKAKSGRAIGEITKGNAAVGYTLTVRGKSAAPRGRRSGASNLHIGGLAGYSMDSMSVPMTGGAVSMTGSGFSVKGAADYRLSDSLGVRFLGGYETFSVTGGGYKTSISYLTLDLLGRYLLTPDSMLGLWLGGGMGFAIPFSKSTTALQEDSVATSTMLYLSAGADIKVSEKFYFPLQFDYAMFLPASDVKTSIIAIRGGVMMRF